MSPDDLPDILNLIEGELGESFTSLYSKSTRARKCDDQSFIPHRLIYLYERIQLTIKWNRDGQGKADFLAMTEAAFFISMRDHWNNTEVWNEISGEISHPESYVHNLIICGWLLIHQDKRAEINPKDPTSGNRSADLRVYNDYGRFIDIEVKAPALLLAPSRRLTDDEAYSIVSKARKKAGSGKKKQIGESSSALIIGGLFIGDKNIDTLKRAAADSFRRNPSTRIAFIEIVTYIIEAKNVSFINGQLEIHQGKSILSSQIHREPVLNPKYNSYPPVLMSEKVVKKNDSEQYTISGDRVAFNNVGENI